MERDLFASLAFVETWICVLASNVKKYFSFHIQKDPQIILGGHLAEGKCQPEPDEGLKAREYGL